jgi:hypothetical protein
MIRKNTVLLLTMLALSGCYHEQEVLHDYQPYELARSGGAKVDLCHVPPGNPANAHTINISVNAVSSHLNNHAGDHLGECTCEELSSCDTGDTGSVDTGVTDTGTTDTGTTDTGTTDTADTADTGSTDTGTTDTGSTPTTPDELWVQGGCNTAATAPVGLAGIFGGLMFLFARRKSEV